MNTISPMDASSIAQNFLRLTEAGDLDTANGLLAKGVVMCFPGALEMTRLDELEQYLEKRFRGVSKTFDAVEAFATDKSTVVYCRGTLAGEWLDGSSFKGIRFIDRFELDRDGLIFRQDVWNDMAVAKGNG